MAESLRFVVEVSADNAKTALKSLTAAFDQAGVQARTKLLQVGPAANQASQGIFKFKENISRSREAAMFFTASLSQFGPAGRTAQIALSGVAGALIGGGGVILALQAAQVAARLVSGYLEDESRKQKEAAKAAEDHARALRDLTRDTDAYLRSLQNAPASLNFLYTELGKLADEAEPLKKRLAELQDQVAQIQEESPAGTVIPKPEEMIEIEQKLARLEERANKVRSEFQRRVGGEEGAETRRASEKAVADAQKERERATADILRMEREIAAIHDQDAKDLETRTIRALKAEAAAKKQALADTEEWYQRNQDAYDDHQAQIRKTASEYERWGNVAADALVGIASGQVTVEDAIKGIGRTILQEIINLLVAKAATAIAMHAVERPTNIAEATSAAGVAGAEGAAAVAGIPIVGPAMAASVAATLPATIMGLTVPLASAAGGMKVPHDMLAMIHEDERVLPAKYSKGLDRLVADAGRGARGGNTYNIAALDGVSVYRVLTDRAGDIDRAERKRRRWGGA